MKIEIDDELMEILVLSVIKRADVCASKIIEDVARLTDMPEFELYAILKELEANDCVEMYSKEYKNRYRKYYKITPIGSDWVDDFEEDNKEITQIYSYISGGAR